MSGHGSIISNCKVVPERGMANEDFFPPVSLFSDSVIKAQNGQELCVGKLWENQPVMILLLRRPGCVMCRAEAQQIWGVKPQLDQLGVRSVCIVHEWIPAEIYEFTLHYWPGEIYLDTTKTLFKVIGGGDLMKGKCLPMLNPFSREWRRYMHCLKKVKKTSHKGTNILGGLMILKKGNAGIHYMHPEKDFGMYEEFDEIVNVAAKAVN